MNDSKNDTTINRVNTQMLKTVYESLQKNPSEMTTVLRFM